MVDDTTRSPDTRNYGYRGPSRRRRLRRAVSILRLLAAAVAAVGGGYGVRAAVELLPSASESGKMVLWLTGTVLLVGLVVLAVSVVGWLLEWYLTTHPEAWRGKRRSRASRSNPPLPG